MRIAFCLAATAALAAVGSAADWPQWLGTNRDGTVPETIAPWKGDLKVAWRVPVGEGHSSPVVVGGLVYLHTKVTGKDAEQIQAFDAKTGAKQWERAYDKPAFTTPFGNGPRATPCVHDGKIYTYGITGTLACWEARSGKPMWMIHVLEDAKKHNLFFGLSASPLIVDDKVIVQGGGSGSKGLKAYDCKTGKPAWVVGDDPASYAAPVFLDKQIVTLTGANLTGVSADGKLLWAVPFKDKLNESSTTPIKAGGMYVAASVTAGAVAVKLASAPDAPAKAEQVWKQPSLSCYFSTPVLVGPAHMYMVTGTLALNPSTTLRCVEISTGKEVWKKANVGKYHAALLALADGKLLMHDDATGDLRLLAPNVKEYEELAKSKAGGSTWAHPAVANGKIYIRDNKEMICLSIGGDD